MLSSFFLIKITIFWCMFIIFASINGLIQAIVLIIELSFFIIFYIDEWPVWSDLNNHSWSDLYIVSFFLSIKFSKKRVKEFRVTGNLNGPNTKMIMANITPYINMRTKIIYSFKSEIHRGAGEIVDYSKTLTSPPFMFTSLEEIQAYIE